MVKVEIHNEREAAREWLQLVLTVQNERGLPRPAAAEEAALQRPDLHALAGKVSYSLQFGTFTDGETYEWR
ncbi:MAG: hypothetical protein KDA60_15345 [Planctomycetales bacterium]|nr:hypothetical protein [Planctomycetales bacterium]